MAGSPGFASYCTARRTLVLFALLTLVLPAASQAPGRRTKSKGPRALGLLEFDSKGRTHLVPVVIMINGEFYDASVYKASPVPMAVDPGIVYEGVETGTSKGLFTIAKAHEVMGVWVGEGKWEVPGSEPPRKPLESKPPAEVPEGPPVLRRHGAQPEAPEPKPTAAPAPEPAAAPKPPEPAPSPDEDDPDRPVLRRSKNLQVTKADDLLVESTPWTVVSTLAAVSDSSGPQPRSYAYSLKPGEDAKPRQEMLAMAAEEIKARAARATSEPGKEKTAKVSAPTFDDVQFRAVDPSASNEAVFVLTAKATVNAASQEKLQYYVVVVAREDIYGDLHKAFARTTDGRHLDLTPRYEFIDAVDADGDGYGELLFRKVYDSGKAYDVYRVIGNQLWPLFEGKPQ